MLTIIVFEFKCSQKSDGEKRDKMRQDFRASAYRRELHDYAQFWSEDFSQDLHYLTRKTPDIYSLMMVVLASALSTSRQEIPSF